MRPLDGAADARELRGVDDLAAPEQLGLQEQAGERRPELVPEHRQELVLGAVRARSASPRACCASVDEVLERVDVDERQDGAVDLVVGVL